jgi:hypothetical protein
MNEMTQEDNVVDLEEWKATPKAAMSEPPKGDWLSRLPSGTEFLTRNTHGLTPDWVVVEWVMLGLHPTGNVLICPGKTPNDTRSWQWVDPLRFCQANEFRGIIDETPREEE